MNLTYYKFVTERKEAERQCLKNSEEFHLYLYRIILEYVLMTLTPSHVVLYLEITN